MKGRACLTAVLLALTLALSLCGCDAVPEPEDTPVPSPSPSPSVSPTPEPEAAQFALGYTSASPLHPLKTTDQSNLNAAALVYEGLYELDGSFEPQPVLAQAAAPSEDGLTWTVTLRQDAVFSDGMPLTAEHVAASLNLARTGGAYSARLAEIVSVTPLEGAVSIALSAPNGALPTLLDVPIVMETGADIPLGTGPYTFEADEDGLSLAVNPHWWQGRLPLYESISLYETQTLEERTAAFDSGMVTAVTIDFNATGAPGYSGTYETHDFLTTNLLFVGFNTAQGACADPAVRRALSQALDRETITASLLSGHAVPSALPVPPESGQYSASAAALCAYDLEAAAARLEEAGYAPNDEGVLAQGRTTLSLTLLVNQDSTAKTAIAQHIAQTLEGLGIAVTVDRLDWAQYKAALAAGQFDLYLGEVKLTGDLDLTALTFGSLNYGGYQNAEVFMLLQNWKAASGAARAAAAKPLLEALCADAPYAPLCFKKSSLLVRWGMVGSLSPVQGNPFAGVENWQHYK